jgi:hypothetical protein
MGTRRVAGVSGVERRTTGAIKLPRSPLKRKSSGYGHRAASLVPTHCVMTDER